MMIRKSLLIVLFCAALYTPAFAGFEEGRLAYDKKDWPSAILNLRPLVESGDPKSMVLLGNMYVEGYGVKKDETEAFGLYRRAAMLDNIDATVTLATMYQQGLGTNTHMPLAVAWFQRAAKLGSQTGAFFYGIHLFQGVKGETFDIKPDHKAAYQWLLIAARGSNKSFADAARQLSLKLADKLTAEDKTAAEADAAGFTPVDPAKLPKPE